MQSTDDLLNSLDFGDSGGGSPELSLDSPLEEVEETMEELEVLDDMPEPAPSRPAERPGRTTLVKDADESEDMRRRIARPSAPAIDVLDDLGSDEDEIEMVAPAPAPVKPGRSFTGLGPSAGRAVDAPSPVSIPVEITADRGAHELTVPIEVSVGRPGTPTHVRLHIALTIKITG
jgi:hypothetical protein